MSEVLLCKDEENQQPVPSVWRPTLSKIVAAFVRGDYRLSGGIAGVMPISENTAAHISDYIKGYGEILTELTEETWETSVVQWMGCHWHVLVDLRTVAEGRSDMVLDLRISECGSEYSYDVHLVYVP